MYIFFPMSYIVCGHSRSMIGMLCEFAGRLGRIWTVGLRAVRRRTCHLQPPFPSLPPCTWRRIRTFAAAFLCREACRFSLLRYCSGARRFPNIAGLQIRHPRLMPRKKQLLRPNRTLRQCRTDRQPCFMLNSDILFSRIRGAFATTTAKREERWRRKAGAL